MVKIEKNENTFSLWVKIKFVSRVKMLLCPKMAAKAQRTDCLKRQQKWRAPFTLRGKLLLSSNSKPTAWTFGLEVERLCFLKCRQKRRKQVSFLFESWTVTDALKNWRARDLSLRELRWYGWRCWFDKNRIAEGAKRHT